MKHFLKVFTITAAILSTLIGISSYAYIQIRGDIPKEYTSEEVEEGAFADIVDSRGDEERINALFLGVDGERADTIMYATYNLEDGKVDVISIPRDTYCDNEYFDAQMKKINAIYPKEGLKGMVETVEEVLGLEDEISYYAEIDYDGVKNIVDSVGGVEVDVPFNMVYRDPHSNPPLNINLRKGIQTLRGQNAVDFLRYRKSNDSSQGYSDGDIGRIEAQQGFVESFIDKAIGLRLPSVIKTTVEEVDTNIRIKDALSYGTGIAKLSGSDIEMHTLPGEARYEEINGQSLSYFFIDEYEIEKMMSGIERKKRDDF